MAAVIGRHRRRGERGLVTMALLLALAVGFLAGVGMGLFVVDGGDDEAASSAPVIPTASPAEADPAPPGPQGEEAYLARLTDEGLPVEQHREAIMVLGRLVCGVPLPERTDAEAVADGLAAVVDDFLSRDQTQLLVRLAARELCGD